MDEESIPRVSAFLSPRGGGGIYLRGLVVLERIDKPFG